MTGKALSLPSTFCRAVLTHTHQYGTDKGMNRASEYSEVLS